MGALMTYKLPDFAKKHGLTTEALRGRWKRNGRPVAWDINRELTDADMDALAVVVADKKKKQPRTVANVVADKVPVAGRPSTRTTWRLKQYALVALMSAPAIASLQNMQSVTHDITHDLLAAWLFTFAFTAAPFIFVVFGAIGRLCHVLTAALIAVEVFCNTVRIYGGLTGFGGSGNPTRFLGIVTEMLNTGTYQTATAIALILSLLAASVLYSSYYQLKK